LSTEISTVRAFAALECAIGAVFESARSPRFTQSCYSESFPFHALNAGEPDDRREPPAAIA